MHLVRYKAIEILCGLYSCMASAGLLEPADLSWNAPIDLTTLQELGDSPVDATTIPRASHSPTQDEEIAQRTAYRKGTNTDKGYIITDPKRGALRQPTGHESVMAVKRAIQYHKENKAALESIQSRNSSGRMNHYLPWNDSAPENEETYQLWLNKAGQDPISGIERLKLRAQQDHDLQNYKEVIKAKPKVGYAPHAYDNPATPSGEFVNAQELTGRDEMNKLTPITHMPPWAGCVEGPTYEQYVHKDLIDSLRPLPVNHSVTLSWEDCAKSCSDAKYDCLGYWRHDKGTVEGKGGVGGDVVHDCWHIPSSGFPKGVNSTMLQHCDYGSLWLKNMSSVGDTKNCTGFEAPPNVVPASDFGTKISPTELLPTATQIAEAKAKGRLMFKDMVSAIDEHEDQDTVQLTRNQSIAYSLQQESVYVQERLEKVEQTNEADVVREQERAKKKSIMDALKARTQKERSIKSDVLHREQNQKSRQAVAARAEKDQERVYKASAEGQIQEALKQQKKEEAVALQEEKEAARTKEYELYVAGAHKAELERLTLLNRNISIAVKDAETGNATLDQIQLLDREGIPYEEDETLTMYGQDATTTLVLLD